MYSGSFVALVTPFDKDGKINYLKIAELIDFHKNNGTDGIVLLGTTGEAPTITEAEAEKMILFAIDKAGEMPLIIGCGSNDTRAATEKARKYEALGAKALLVLTPYYNKANDIGMIRHFMSIADAVDIPIIIYNVPSRTGCSVSVSALEVLREHENIIGIKEASGDMSYFMRVSRLIRDDFSVFCGNDDIAVPMVAAGACGVISVLANICPAEVSRMISLARSRDFAAASEIQRKYLPLIGALFSEPNPIPVKAAMNRLGFDVGPCRLPLCEMSEAKFAALETELEKLR